MFRLTVFIYLIFLCTVLFAQPQTSVLPVTTYQPAGFFQNQSSFPRDFLTHGSNVFFSAGSSCGLQLFRTDGVELFEVVTSDGFPLIHDCLNGYESQVFGNELFAFGYHQDQMGLWHIPNDSFVAQLAATFDIGTEIRMVHTGRGVLIAIFQADAVEMRYFDGQDTHTLDNLPKSDPASWLAVSHGDRALFVLGVPGQDYQLWQWDGSQVSGFADITPQLSSGASATPEEGSQLLSYEDGLALVREFVLDDRRVWTLHQIDSSGQVQQLIEAGGDWRNPGVGTAFVLEGRLYFEMGETGLHFLNGADVVSFETLVPGFDAANPKGFLPAEGGFYYIASQPGNINNTDNLVKWFDLQTGQSTLLFSHAEDWVDKIYMGSDGRAWFPTRDGGIASTGLFRAVWSTDGTLEGTRRISYLWGYYGSLAVLGDAVFFSRKDDQWGIEPVVSIGDQLTFLGDLVTAPPTYLGEIDRQTNFATGRVLVTAADDGSEQLIVLEGAEARTLASLEDMIADAVVTVADSTYVFTQYRSQLHQVTQAGLTLMAEYDPAELRLSRVLTFGDQRYYTAYAGEFFPNTDENGLSGETHLYRYDPDGQDEVIFQMTGRPSQQMEVASLGGSLIHSASADGIHTVRAWRDGNTQELFEVPASLGDVEVHFHGVLEDSLIVRVRQTYPTASQNPNDPAEHLYYAVTPDRAELLWQGLAKGSRWINNRVVLIADNQIFAIDLDGTEAVFAYSGNLNLNFHDPQEPALFFDYQDDVWISDGTAEGTKVYLRHMTSFQTMARVAGYHYFYPGAEFPLDAPLMALGPDDILPQPVADMPFVGRPGGGFQVVHQNHLYFSGHTSAHGEEIWRLEGDRAYRVTDLRPGPRTTLPFGLVSTPSGLYFQTGSEIGSETGTGIDVYLLQDLDQPDEPDQPEEDQVSLSFSGELKPFRGARAKLLNLPAGARVSWRIQGGTVFARPQADTVIFKVGAGPVLNLTAEITLPDGEVQTLTSQAIVSPLDLNLAIVTY